ncbi:MAG: zinc-ribbon domain-containing protein [Ruminococcus sp.]|nr:zinc-ribbon domain-containing protein [Ruminococcus sp.]
MFCESCGKKNPKEASFCGYCGKPINPVNKEQEKTKETKNSFIKEFKELPKRTKIVMLSVSLVVVISFIVLVILLNNPLKKLEDNLAHYYDNYHENNTKELIEMGRIISNNKDKPKVLNSIKETTNHITSIWVKNFNTSYKDKDLLDEAYKKLSKSLNTLYNYYNGLEYILSYDLYNEYMDELDNLYSSKKAYLEALEYENKKDYYYAYYYYQKVIENDSYYHLAQKYTDNYIKDELDAFKDKVSEIIDTSKITNAEEKLDVYLKGIEYLDNNKVVNNIDLSASDDYKKLYEDILTKIVSTTKVILESIRDDYDRCLEIIDKVEKSVDSDNDIYEELEDLKEEYEEKKPVSLLGKLISSTNGFTESKYTRAIKGVEYENNLAFKFNNSLVTGVYHLDKEYKHLKMRLIYDSEIKENIKGTLTIYGDKEELYKSSSIFDINDLDIDVTNIENLKIEFIGEDSSNNDIYIYLVEPYLYK